MNDIQLEHKERTFFVTAKKKINLLRIGKINMNMNMKHGMKFEILEKLLKLASKIRNQLNFSMLNRSNSRMSLCKFRIEMQTSIAINSSSAQIL